MATKNGTGRKSGIGDTRGKLIEAAERAFAESGYDGASLRDIALAARVPVGLLSYHFKSKEQLFDEVIGRRAIEVNRRRLAALDRIKAGEGASSDTVRRLIEAHFSPVIEARYGSSPGWRRYGRLTVNLMTSTRWTPVISKYYDEYARIFLLRLREALPEADNDTLLNAMSFMQAAMWHLSSNTKRFSRWKRTRLSSEAELKAMTEDLVEFVHGGFMSLSSRSRNAANGRKPRKPGRAEQTDQAIDEICLTAARNMASALSALMVRA